MAYTLHGASPAPEGVSSWTSEAIGWALLLSLAGLVLLLAWAYRLFHSGRISQWPRHIAPNIKVTSPRDARPF